MYITGGSQAAGGSWDVLTLKYRLGGFFAWAVRHNNSSTRFDRGLAIAVSGSSVYVAGVSNRAGHGDDVVLIKYSLGGAKKWVRYYDDPQHRSETVTGIAVRGSAIYVCGSGKSGAVVPGDAMLLRFGTDGSRKWAKYVAGNGNGDDVWNDVAVDGKGRAHVTGTWFRTTTADDIVTSVYYPSGTVYWRAWFWTAGGGLDMGSALAVDGSRRTYVCGSVDDGTGHKSIKVLAYGASPGPTLWSSLFPDPVNYSGDPLEADDGDDWPSDIALVSGALYVVGGKAVARAGGSDADFLTVKIER